MTDGRRNELLRIARQQILHHLQSDLAGRSEHIMKEAWEECADDSELAVMDAELRAIIRAIKERSAEVGDGRSRRA